jgi:hypothetical protein
MNSQTKCNAVELCQEGFGWGFEAEALSGCADAHEDDVIEIGV